MSPHIRLSIWVGSIVAFSWLTVTFIEPDLPNPLEEAALGYFFGTMFAHATLAAAWCAFGPGHLIWRIPLSLMWIILVVFGIGVNIGLHGGPESAVTVVGVCLVGQYVALQFPLWLLAFGFRIQLRHISEANSGVAKQLQFGISHLLIVTAIAAGLMGAGRLALATMPRGGEYPVFIFLVVAAVIQSVPLLLSALMRRYAIPAALAIAVFIAIATVWEVSLLQSLKLGPGPDMRHLIAINLFTCLFTLIVAITVRLNGFSLTMRAASKQV